jgi:hypothetical protein
VLPDTAPIWLRSVPSLLTAPLWQPLWMLCSMHTPQETLFSGVASGSACAFFMAALCRINHNADGLIYRPTFCSSINMSDNLLQTVPIFNGDNLRGWKTTMEAVLQSKDCFWVIDSERPPSSDVKERQEWDRANQRCIGNIKLRVSQSIQEMIAAGNEVADETEPTTTVQDQATQADGTTATSISSASRSICARGAKVITKTRVPYSAKQIWSLLDNKFSANVTGTHYADFHAMMKVVIPGNEHPTKALQAFHAAVERLRLNGIEFPEQLEALILSWKLPSAYNTTQTMINFAAHDTDAMCFDTISNAIVRAWEGQLGLPSNKNQAQKLSAVCCAPQQPPQF